MKIGIVGSGFVGATAAYAMVMQGIGREIVLVDKSEKRAQAESYDISHAIPFSYPMLVRKGTYSDLKHSKLVIISAGVSQKPGESRIDLLKRNAGVFREVIPKILESTGDVILVVATNPLDIMTYLAGHFASEYGLSHSKVFGTGTMLDTARFRTLISEHIHIDPQHVHGYVIGEHGDSEVLTWSLVTVGGMTLDDYCNYQGISMNTGIRSEIDTKVREAAYRIIEGKGATYYGIGTALAKVADVILHDQRSILTVSSHCPDVPGLELPNVAISMPHLLGGDGVLRAVPIRLNEAEKKKLSDSANVIHDAVQSLV